MQSPADPTSLAPTVNPPEAWWSEFHSYFDHGHFRDQTIALAWTIPLIAVSCWLGRRWLGQNTPESISREKQLCSAWAGFIIGVNVWSLVYWLQPAHYDITRSLPLHMCDIAALLAPLLFLTHWRPIRSIMYFWGIGLSTQAFITPTLTHGIGEQRYWLFWLGHLAIVGSAVYDLVVRRYRPALRDYLGTTAITIGWYAGVFWLNTRLHANYGYNGNVPMDRPTLIDSLGPWPARAFILAAIAITWFGVLWAVWPLFGKLADKRRSK
jgi:hypothetical integral membrane protein (TIGR02206 family)